MVARPTPEAAELFRPLGEAAWAEADSVLAGDPAAAGMFAIDGDLLTAWLAGYGNRAPVLELSWDRPRRIDRLQVDPAPNRARPAEAVITTAGERRVVGLGSDDLGFFDPLVTDRVRIEFRAGPGLAQPPVMGFGELRIDGLENQKADFDPASRTGAVCGLGPEISIDGRIFATKVVGTLQDVLLGTPLRWRTCRPSVQVPLGTGSHEVVARATQTFAPTILALVAGPTPVVEHRLVEGPHAPGGVFIHRSPGRQSVFTFGSNFNRGWSALLEGGDLKPVTDGWQQGFIVPAGSGGEIRVRFLPEPSYTWALAWGLLGAITVVLALALTLRWPGQVLPTPLREPSSRRLLRTRPRGGRWGHPDCCVSARWLDPRPGLGGGRSVPSVLPIATGRADLGGRGIGTGCLVGRRSGIL